MEWEKKNHLQETSFYKDTKESNVIWSNIDFLKCLPCDKARFKSIVSVHVLWEAVECSDTPRGWAGVNQPSLPQAFTLSSAPPPAHPAAPPAALAANSEFWISPCISSLGHLTVLS